MPRAFIESLESRTLFSGAIAAELVGTLPQTLLTASADHVSLQFSNPGEVKAVGGADVNLYLSAQPGITAGSVLIGSASKHLGIKPGGEAQLSAKFKLPATLADGQYFLTARIATKGIQTTNGSAIEAISDPSPVTVQSPTDSLVGAFATSPIAVGLDTAGNAGTGTVKLRVTNPTAAAIHGIVSANLYLSTAIQLNATTQWVGTLRASGITIQPGRSITIRGNVTVPATTDFGAYHLLAVLKNTPSGGAGTAVFARQPITVTAGADDSDTGDDTGTLDTGDTGDDGDTTPTSAPTTQDNGGDTTQPTTALGDDDGDC
jgi:hypothetical protein